MYTPYTTGYAKWLNSSLLNLSGVLLVTLIVQTAKILKTKGLIPWCHVVLKISNGSGYEIIIPSILFGNIRSQKISKTTNIYDATWIKALLSSK